MKKILVIIIGVAIAVGAYFLWNKTYPTVPAAPELQGEEEVKVSIISYSEYAGAVERSDYWAQVATGIFVAKVGEKIGNELSDSKLASTQYSVEVLSSLKGSARGTVTLNQAGVGYKKDGTLSAVEGDMVIKADKAKASDIFLKQGGTYLFMALSDSRNIYTISVPPYDRVLITTDASLSNAELLALAEKHPTVVEYRKQLLLK